MVTAKIVFERLVEDTHIKVLVDSVPAAEYAKKSVVPPELLAAPIADWGFGFTEDGTDVRGVHFELHYNSSDYPLKWESAPVEAATRKVAERKYNGMISVPDIRIKYRGYTIQPKLDMGSTPWLVDGNSYSKGYIVTRDHAQIMPGGAWFHSVTDAKLGIDTLIAAGGDGERFWELLRRAQGLEEYEEV